MPPCIKAARGSLFPDVFNALATLPRGTVIDGEVVALDETGRPDFHLLTHSRRSAKRIRFFVFDVLFFNNEDVMAQPLLERRKLLKSIIPESETIKLLEYFPA